MPLINSYALWNNKGGVGKSTISFHLSMRYAETHPNEKILVIDLCPQSNSSMMLLGGGTVGDERVIELCSRAVPKSVVGYVRKCLQITAASLWQFLLYFRAFA